MTDYKTAIKRLGDLGVEASRAGMYEKAVRIWHQARDLAEQNRDEEMLVKSLFWEGHCLQMLGKYDQAMPLLMEAANCRSPEADPADVFIAAIMLIIISLSRKNASYCRKLIEQTREYLSGINQQKWEHNLDLLEGRLEYDQGNFQDAFRCFVQAWETCPQTTTAYPSYTPSSYLYHICKTAFALHEPEQLTQWVTVIEACDKRMEGDKIDSKLSRLLLFRAECSEGGDFFHAPEFALSTLEMIELHEARTQEYKEFIIQCLRILALAGRWKDLEYQLERFLLRLMQDFDYFLFRGDEQQCRARAALGMAVKDDEYDLDFPLPESDIPDPESGLKHLRQAAEFYENAREDAQKEDELTETAWYTNILNERLARVRAIEDAL